jgi:hypothetical protein
MLVSNARRRCKKAIEKFEKRRKTKTIGRCIGFLKPEKQTADGVLIQNLPIKNRDQPACEARSLFVV